MNPTPDERAARVVRHLLGYQVQALRLAEGLREYGEHKLDCATVRGSGPTCDCGYTALLEGEGGRSAALAELVDAASDPATINALAWLLGEETPRPDRPFAGGLDRLLAAMRAVVAER